MNNNYLKDLVIDSFNKNEINVSDHFYTTIIKLSGKFPSNKLLADIIYNNITNYSLGWNNYENWSYTTKIVNILKGNLAVSNREFTNLCENGRIDNYLDGSKGLIKLFDYNNFTNNEIYLVRNFRLKIDNETKNIDFIIIVNNIPVGVILCRSKSLESLHNKFYDFTDFAPNLFRFTRMVFYINDNSIYLGSIFDSKDDIKETKMSINNMDRIFSKENIIEIIKNKKEILNIYLEKNIEYKEENSYKKVKFNKIDVGSKLKKLSELPKPLKITSELDFLDEIFFEQDITDKLESDEFSKEKENYKEALHYRYNKEYIEKFQNGDNNSLSDIIQANEKLVRKELLRISNKYKVSGFEEELLQEGRIGLIEATKKFDLERGHEFSTYAYWWIRQRMLRYIVNNFYRIRMPAYVHQYLNTLNKLENESNIKFGNIVDSYIIQNSDFDKSKIDDLRKIRYKFLNYTSLNESAKDNPDKERLEDVKDPDISVSEQAEFNIFIENIKSELETLSEKEKIVLVKRFGLFASKEYTLEEIGDELGFTRERIRQIEKKSLEKLSRRKSLRNIMEELL